MKQEVLDKAKMDALCQELPTCPVCELHHGLDPAELQSYGDGGYSRFVHCVNCDSVWLEDYSICGAIIVQKEGVQL